MSGCVNCDKQPGFEHFCNECKHETRTVLGRVFTWTSPAHWECKLSDGSVLALYDHGHTGAALRWGSALQRLDWCDTGCTIAVGAGDSPVDAILALQATLRKMAELEVAE